MRALLAAFSVLFLSAGTASAQPTLEDYAADPVFGLSVMSEDGRRLAVINTQTGNEVICVIELDSRAQQCYAAMNGVRATKMEFIGSDQLLVVASERTQVEGFNYRFDRSAPFILELSSGELLPLIRHSSDMRENQTGVGYYYTVGEDNDRLFLQAYNGRDRQTLDMFNVIIERRVARVHRRGGPHTIDWIMDRSGEPIARENYDEGDGLYFIEVPEDSGNAWREIFREQAELRSYGMSGVSLDGQSLVFARSTGDLSADGMFLMSLQDGAITGPFHVQPNKEILRMFKNADNQVIGMEYSGVSPSYHFFDERLNAEVQAILEQFNGIQVYVNQVTDSRILLGLSGNGYSGNYVIYDRASGQFVLSLPQRPAITAEHIGAIASIEYRARDGLTIPAIVTWPPGVDPATAENLPLVVMPHGGPEAHDTADYDWLSQAIAAQGYMVLQPNFRGSTGFGRAHSLAGYGEWGGAMQDDVSDGVQALIQNGWADADRVCIVGWSYGGYSALAGGAFTPELYQCVASVAGVSDLHRMLISVRDRNRSSATFSYRYWIRQFGEDGIGHDDLSPISPAEHAEAFQAPVLLLHGSDDLIVPVDQSIRMEDALEDAGKSVRFRVFDGQNHSIMDTDARLEVLRELTSFINEHIGE